MSKKKLSQAVGWFCLTVAFAKPCLLFRGGMDQFVGQRRMLKLPVVAPAGWWLVVMLLFGTPAGLSGNEQVRGDTIIQHFTVRDGLPNRTVFSSSFDYDHLLWAGTAGGLCRTDGRTITAFTDFPETFSGYLHRDDRGFLISLTESAPDSIEIFDPHTLRAYGARLGTLREGVFAGASYTVDRPLYFARGSTISTYRPGEGSVGVHQLREPVGAEDKLLYADGQTYLLYRQQTHQVERFDKGETDFLLLPPQLAPRTVFRDQSGGLWLSNVYGLYYLPAGGQAFEPKPGLASGREVNFIAEDVQGQVLIGYLNPIMKRMQGLELMVDGGRISMEWLQDIDDRIITVAGNDFLSDLRLNTYGGLFLVRIPQSGNSPFKQYLYRSLTPGKFGDVMRGFTADQAGNVYVNKDSRMPYWFRVNAESLTLDTLVMRENDGTIADHYGCGTNLLNYQGDIFGHSCDLAGATFLGTIYRYRPADQSWKKWNLPEQNQVVRWVMPGRVQDELLLITENKQNYRNGRLFYFYPERDSFHLVRPTGPEYTIEGYTKDVEVDTVRHCLWIGTDRALYRFDPQINQLTAFRMAPGETTPVTEILLTKQGGDLMLGTLKFGLQNFEPETGLFTTIGGQVVEGEAPPDPKNFLELPSNDIAGVRIADGHNLLVFTFNGLVLHGPQTQTTSIYTTADGLNDNEFNTSSVFQNKQDGRWYAGGINGFVSFRTQDLLPKPSPFQPALLSYRILDEKVGYETIHHVPANWEGPLELPPSVIYCAFDFSVPDFILSGAPRFQTKLDGFDPDWNTPAATTTVRYTKLNPGDYKFHLRAYDAEGRSSTETRTVVITVLRPWYNTYFFYLCCIGLLLLVLYTLHTNKMARLAKDLEAERRVQSLELRSLRQQLNPHFISNAMNAIREYIQRADPKDAVKYLTDFSLMMRLFLESSRKRQTTIADETNMLQRYINLEQLRFPGKFSAEIVIDSALDPDMDEIPSLLLQPIIENAINHGLRPLERGGELMIDLRLDPNDEDVLLCKVSDNGIGRKEAAKRPKTSEYVSRATQILEDRTNLLAEDARIRLTVRTEDLFPDRKHTGTVVTLRIEGA